MNTILNKDTLETVARFILKCGVGYLAGHGIAHAKDFDTPVSQTILEEVLASIVGAASLWWSKKQQQKIAAAGNTQTFTKTDPTPGLPKAP